MRTNNKFKILIILFNIFLLIFIFTSCTKINNDDEQVEIICPTEEFSVNEYIQSNMILQKETDNYITGTAEPKVKIFVDLINNKEKTIVSLSTITDKDGNWEILLEAPDNTKINYTLSIYDSFKKYIKKYENIYFGNVIIILGEKMFFNKVVDEKFDISNYSNLRICDSNGKWHQNNSDIFSLLLTGFMVQLYDKMENSIVGFVDLSFESASIGAFLNKKILKENSDLETYNNNVFELLDDDDSRKHTYQNAEIYDSYINNFFKVSCYGVISYLGTTDYNSGIDFENNDNLFAKSMSLFIKNLSENFIWKNFIVIESPSISNETNSTKIDNIALLRNAQSTAAYYNNGIILPIYELGNNYSTEAEQNIFIKNLVNLVSNRLLTNLKTPSYANLIIKDDEIIIEFSNCIQLNEIEMITNFKICKKNGDDITNLYEYYIIDNRIIISKVLESADFSNITILYNFQADIKSGNLYNEDAQAVNPFIIILEGEG